MYTEKYYLKKLTKVFTEGIDNHWWFDIEKYIRLASKYNLDATQLRNAIQCVEEDETKNVISAKTIGRVLGYYNGEKEGRGSKAVTLETVKSLGKALCDGDEYGLLIKIEPKNVMRVMKEAEELWGQGELSKIYRMLNNLLYEMEVSSNYNYKPGTQEDGYEYYDMKLQMIRNEIDSHFWNRNVTRLKLYRLVDEVECLIKSFSIPGAVDRWITINPRLRFYDSVFSIKEEAPEIYEKIKNGEVKAFDEVCVHFSFYPTVEDCRLQKEYFANIEKRNLMQHCNHSYVRLYQNEIVETFQMVFENDFNKN